MALTKTNPTRRGFLAGIAAATAATALPSTAEARPRGTASSWAALRTGLPGTRAAYLAEVAQLAEELRPRFAAGELRGVTDDDLEDGEHGATSPRWELEKLCAERFGCTVTTTEDHEHQGDAAAAHLVLACSPRAAVTDDSGWDHVGHHATAAATWDVLAVARERGMYVPGADEEEDPLLVMWCACGHRAAHHAGACVVATCACEGVHDPRSEA